jgi:hypothetical protein
MGRKDMSPKCYADQQALSEASVYLKKQEEPGRYNQHSLIIHLRDHPAFCLLIFHPFFGSFLLESLI